MDYTSVLGDVLVEVLELAASATSGQVHNIIGLVQKLVPVAVEAEQTLIGPLQGIIARLQQGTLTLAQIDALQAESEKLDKALDDAAEVDGLV